MHEKNLRKVVKIDLLVNKKTTKNHFYFFINMVPKILINVGLEIVPRVS